MTHCSVRKNTYKEIITSASLIFHNGTDLKLQELRVSNSSASGFAIVDVTGDISIDGSNFTDAYITGDHARSGNTIAFNTPGKNATVTVSNTRFLNNSYMKHGYCQITDLRLSAGLAIILRRGKVDIQLSSVSLIGNGGCAGGNMAIILFDLHRLIGSTMIQLENNSIDSGMGNVGGGIFVTMVNSDASGGNATDSINPADHDPPPVLVIKNSTFTQNTAHYVGGAIYLKQLETTHHFPHPGIMQIEGCQFENNSINGSGGLAIHFTTFVIREYIAHSRPQVKVNVLQSAFMHHNKVENAQLGKSVIFVKTSPHFAISDTKITENDCTGLLGISSSIIISSNVTISQNRAFKGGGVLLCSGAMLFFKMGTNMEITGNKANHTGGGIEVESECTISKPRCFFQFDSDNSKNESKSEAIRVRITDNHADYSGENINGGSIENCYMIDHHENNNSKSVFEQIFDVSNNSHGFNHSSISSAPQQVCHRDNLTHQLNCEEHEIEVYPGQTKSFDGVLVGQMHGLVPGTVHADKVDSWVYLKKDNYIQKISSISTKPKLSYLVYSKKENANTTIYLTPEGIGAKPHSKRFKLHIHIKNCPLGYQLNIKSSQSSCSCPRLRKYIPKRGLTCKISRFVGIQYQPPVWIGLINVISEQGEAEHAFAASKTCPRDYCNFTKNLLLGLENLTVESGAQCFFNRMGVLCGGCKNESYSLIFGSSKCRAGCSNYSFFFLALFALAGLALVVFINLLNMTVTVGTVNGLIFYANIIQIYNFILFENNHTPFLSPFLKIFTAWLNLDFGIEVCFFKGMNGLAKSLLQFAFPLYIWTIAGAIIFLSKRSSLIALLLGKNSVQVLATLILHSYSKILRAAMDALHFTRVYLTDLDRLSFRWTIDGHYEYLKGWHIVVFIVGAIFVLVSFPFMAALLCVQHTGKVSHWRVFSWVNHLKPFFDSYTGPYQDKARFWVGLLLLVRILLLGFHSLSIIPDSDAIVMAVVSATCFVLLFTSMVFPKGLYKNHWLNVLENFFIANLGVLFLCLVCSMYYYSNHNDQKIRVYVVNISIGISALIFGLIVSYHVMAKFRCLPRIKSALSRRKSRRWYGSSYNFTKTENGNVNQLGIPPYQEFDADREPLLATEIY